MRKVAIVYDRVNKWGGAERVLLALHEIFPKAPLYTSVYDSKNASWAKVFTRIETSFLQKIPFARSNHELFAPLMPLAFAMFDFSKFDVVISVTSEAAKGIRTESGTLHICYCLTPTRYLWSGYEEYFSGGIFKFFTKPIVNILRQLDIKSASKPDVMVGISTEVKKRIKKYYNRKSQVIFPPVNMGRPVGKSVKKHFLLVSRLDYGYKKVDLAIKAFNEINSRLVIVGTGREGRRLKKMAGKNIIFAGRVSDKKLRSYYKEAKALVMPQEEDFGIVAVEAQNHGVPVIAFAKGGSTDTVINKKTGILFNKQSPKSLKNAISLFEKYKFKQQHLYANSKKFSKAIFKKNILALINKYSRMYNNRLKNI